MKKRTEWLFESFKTKMGDEFLFGKKKDPVFLSVDPNGQIALFCGFGDQEHGPQFIEFSELVQSNLRFGLAPMIEKNLLIDSVQHQMGASGCWSGV